MYIQATEARINSEQALATACKDYPSLPERIFYRIFPSRYPRAEILATKPFYYPYYCCNALLTFNRPGLPARVIKMTVVMDGCFGSFSKMKGIPHFKREQVDNCLVARSPYHQEQLSKMITDYAVRKNMLKYKGLPAKTEIEGLIKVYKPMFVCLCQRKQRQFYRVIDAEVNEREYFVEYNFSKICFHEKNQPSEEETDFASVRPRQIAKEREQLLTQAPAR